jgi:hypothetical protein
MSALGQKRTFGNARELGGSFWIDPVLLVRDVDCARNMTAANCADIFANELPRSAHVDNLHIRIVQPRHHLFGRDRYCRIDLQFERDGGKLRGVTADRPAGGRPVLDAFMVDTHIAAAEILQGVETEIGIPGAAAMRFSKKPGRQPGLRITTRWERVISSRRPG